MALSFAQMTRDSSADSSALSNIEVAGTVEEDIFSEQLPGSTPPTSLAETSSVGSTKAAAVEAAVMSTVEEEGAGGRKSRRSRASVNYNLKTLSDAQMPDAVAGAESGSRNVSGLTGRTLVNGEEDEEAERGARISGTPFEDKVERALDMSWEIPDELPPRPESAGQISRREAVKARVKKAAGKVSSVLGKRRRDAMEVSKRKIVDGKRKLDEMKEKGEKSRYLRELDMGPKGLLDEIDLDAEEAEPARPSKKIKKKSKAPTREAAPLVAASTASGVATGRRGKRWQREGLFVGQSTDPSATNTGVKRKAQSNRLNSSTSNANPDAASIISEKQSFVTLPMFNHLSTERDFIIPFDLFAPTARKGDEKPKDWHQLNKNRLVGEAKTLWEKEERLARSLCICNPPGPGEQGCDYDCLNRAMHYECNDNNCILAESECSNRPFAELAARMKKAGPYDIGVEVVKTHNRGFGVRSCRTFAPGQIIMEYTGEIISEGECQRRMAELYSNKPNYYLMEFDKGLVIDGTKGSMARFVNHSCAPNCEVRMLTVNGTPRMGVFAGDEGVMTGEELTYDYNFDNFGSTRQKCYCGAPSCRGYLSKRLNATEQKLRDKEEKENKRRAAEEAEKNAEALIKAKKTKDQRGSNWRGWVTVAEIKEQLKREKAEREEAEKNSSRARRLAARKSAGGVSSAATTPAPEIKEEKSDKRRKLGTKSIATAPPLKTQKPTIRRVSSESVRPVSRGDTARERKTSSVVERKASNASRKTTASRPGHKRTHSALSGAGSKFTEDLSPKLGRPSTSSELSKTKSEVNSVAEDPVIATYFSRSLHGAADSIELDTRMEGDNIELQPPSKRHRLGAMVKNVFGGGKKGIAGSALGGSGKLRQSTLSFSKLG